MAQRLEDIVRQCIVIVMAVVCLVAMRSRPVLAQDDSFVRQRNIEEAANGSTGFSVSFAGAQRSFHPGEMIKLLFTFSRNDVSPYNYERCRGLGMAEAVLDHVEGTVDPQADLWDNGIISPGCGLIGGVIGGAIGIDGKVVVPRIQFPVYLNQGVRFDRPGRYRLYVRSHHELVGGNLDDRRPPLISNVLEFDIVERDRAWDARTLVEAIQVLDASGDAAARMDAARSIAYLATPEAVDEMARRLDRHPPAWAGPIDADLPFAGQWLRGLSGARARADVVARLEQELDRKERYIAPRFVSHLAVLSLTGRLGSRPIERSAYESLVRSYSVRHFAVLKTDGTLIPELRRAFLLSADHELRIGAFGLASGFGSFPDDVEQAFATLSPSQQRRFLMAHRNWTVLAEPAFIPMLRRLTGGRDPHGPQDLALRLLYELAPVEGRQIVLKELVKRGSAIGIVGVGVLPDHRLAGFDNALAGLLEDARTADEYRAAMDRIERFATGRIATRVRRVYEQFKGTRGCALAPAALAYFFRVAPAYARTEIGKVMREVYEGDRCESGVLSAIGERRMVPALEDTAIGLLGDGNGWVVADAARMLQEYGSSRAEAPLWRAMERWHERWKDQETKLETDMASADGSTWEEANEDHLATALMEGTGWLTTAAAVQRLISLCVTEDCRFRVSLRRRTSATSLITIDAYPSALPGGEPTYSGNEQTPVWLKSRQALHRWVSLHQKASAFALGDNGFGRDDDGWRPGEEEALFQEMRAFLESRDMKVVRRR